MYGIKSKQIKSPSDCPEGKHYQIIVFDVLTYGTEAYGQYETNKVDTPKIYVTKDKQEWAEDISLLKLPPSSKSILACVVESKASIKVMTQVEVK